jgi:hypothetical protein
MSDWSVTAEEQAMREKVTYPRQSIGWDVSPRRPLADPVPEHLIRAIFAATLFCLPLRIVAIAFATQVRVQRAAGDLRAAAVASTGARGWSTAAFWVGGTFHLLTFVIFGIKILRAGLSGA